MPVRFVLLVIIVASIALSGVFAGDEPGSQAGDTSGAKRGAGGALVFEARVVRTIDGDTIRAQLASGKVQKVRLLGIDTPENSTLRTGRAECGGDDASEFTNKLAKRWPLVTLRSDPGQDGYDQYGRLLAYVEPKDDQTTTFQEELLRAGWAKVYVFRGDPFSRVREFRDAATEGRDSGRGVWAACGGDFRRPLGG